MDILRSGNPARRKLDAIQAQIVETGKQIAAAENAVYSIAETRERIAGAVRAAVKDDPALAAMHQLRSRLIERLSGRPIIGRQPGWGILAALLGEEEIVARIMSTFPADEIGMTNAERDATLAELRSRLVDLERKEEREILQLQQARWAILRRADVNLDTLFEIWGEHAPESDASALAEPLAESATAK